MSSAAQKASAALFSMVSLEAAATRATTRELSDKIYHELRIALPSREDAQHTPIGELTRILSVQNGQLEPLANLELFLRSKRMHNSLMERYNPLYGMSEQDRIKATARRVGLDVPADQKA